MNIFLDTSSLLKLYHFENGTTELITLIQGNLDNSIFISELALVEIHSAIYKKVRTGEINNNTAAKFLELFQQDVDQFTIIPLNSQLVQSAQQLIISYGIKGLRTLDALQLASIITIKSTINLTITHDDLLKSFLMSENINTQL